jgi:Na+/H+-dicarboxylate symporter
MLPNLRLKYAINDCYGNACFYSSAAVPSAGMVMYACYCFRSAGIPEAGLALIFAIDRPLDMCRTVVNVTSDSTVATIVAM